MDGYDGITLLRDRLATAVPGGEHDVECRLRLTSLLLQRFEDATGQDPDVGPWPDLDDLEEVLHHVDRVLVWTDRGDEAWLWATELRMLAHRHRYEALNDPDDLDTAISAQRVLVASSDSVDTRAELAGLLVERYSTTEAHVDLLDAATELRAVSAAELSAADRIDVDFDLGRVLVELLRWDRVHGTRTAAGTAAALDVLTRTFDVMDPDDPRGPEILLDTARVHAMRSELADVDADAEREEAIGLFRGLAAADTRAAIGLAVALSERYDVGENPSDRDEAIAVLRGLDAVDDVESTPVDRASILGELLLARARENPDEVDDLVRYLEDAYRDAPPADPVLGTLLMEALCLRWPIPTTDVDRVVALLDAITAAHPEDAPDHRPLLGVRAVALTARALDTSAEDDLAVAERELRVASRDVLPFDWSHLLLLGLLGAVVVVRHGGAVPADWPHPLHLAHEFPPERRADVLRFLEEHRAAGSREDPDLLCAVALLRADRTRPFDSGRVAEHEDFRRTTIGLLEAARAALPDGDELDVALTQQLGHQYADLGRLLESGAEIARGLALFDDVLGRIDEAHPLHSTTTTLYAVAVMAARLLGGSGVTAQHARRALVLAAGQPDLGVAGKVMYLQALAIVEFLAWTEDSASGDLTTAANLLQQALAMLPVDDPDHDDVRHNLAIVLMDRYRSYGELHDLDAAEEHLQALLVTVRARGDQATVDESAVVETFHQLQLERSIAKLTGPEHDPGALVAVLRAREAELEARAEAGDHVDGHVLATVRNSLGVALVQKAHAEESADALTEAVLVLRRSQEGIRPGTTAWAWFVTSASGTSALANVVLADRAGFDVDVRSLTEVWDDQGLSIVARERAACTLMGAWLAWHVRSGDSAALDAALDLFDRIDAFGGDSHGRGDIAMAVDQVADACWARAGRGDVDRAVELGFWSLRTRARDVLRQTANDHGLRQTADASGRALTVMDRCLSVGFPERAVEAVEWGRALVLATTTATTDVATLLSEQGMDALAEEWRRAATSRGTADRPAADVDFAPDDLRRRVLTALSGEASGRRLLAPPSVPAIADALRRLDSDVLAYLVPGRALLVLSDQRAIEVPLPLLRHESSRGLALEALCEWAWRVAVGPLLTRIRALLPGARAPRLVVVPNGDLGVVPWHAARDGDRVAVREAVFSSASSARQFHDLATRPRPPIGRRPVVVNDPTGDLPGAMLDAEFLHGRFPDGEFYGVELDGVPHSGHGTPEEVLEAVPGASLLHLGCHAESGPTPARSFLRLTEGSVLTVDRVLDRARGRAEGTASGLVVLAACQSDASQADHDEALTLASAFVAAGATGVVGTKWEVHDIGASVLVCVFYTELLGGNPRPRDALRAAQLWALDPARVVPPGLPPFLAKKAAVLDLAHPSLWAAFTHQGW